MSIKIIGQDQVVELVKAFCQRNNIPVEDVVLGGGAALIMRGVRGVTEDMNVWIEETHFQRLAKELKVICHPMVDTVLNPGGEDHQFWIRKFNPYFGTEQINGVRCFDVLTLTIQKRGGMIRVERPLKKRQQDREDLINLDALSAEKNKVRA